MKFNTPLLRLIDKGVCEIINSHDGLWRKIGELARNMEYVLIEDPLKKLSRQLDVIEQNIGITEKTTEIRNLISSQHPA